MCGVEPRADALSDTCTKLKMIVALVPEQHFSSPLSRVVQRHWREIRGDGLNTEERKVYRDTEEDLKSTARNEEDNMSRCFPSRRSMQDRIEY